MTYTPKIQKAINFAIKVHQLDQNQTRKGKTVPYITHPLSVGLILANVRAQEDVVVAGILHDTIEDCKPWGSITKEMLALEFGDDVARMVNDVTEQDKSLSWAVRKQQAFDRIPEMEKDSLMVKSADVLHNLREQIADYKVEGEEIFKRFNAPKEVQLERYRKLAEALKAASKDNALLVDLDAAVTEATKLWGEIEISKQYAVHVDDNFHYMDESERYVFGTFETYDSAEAACKQIVDEYLEANYKKGVTAEQLYDSYTSFGEDPFIVSTQKDDDTPHYSSWNYAKNRCAEICSVR